MQEVVAEFFQQGCLLSFELKRSVFRQLLLSAGSLVLIGER
jgi:hypothetical protein